MQKYLIIKSNISKCLYGSYLRNGLTENQCSLPYKQILKENHMIILIEEEKAFDEIHYAFLDLKTQHTRSAKEVSQHEKLPSLNVNS